MKIFTRKEVCEISSIPIECLRRWATLDSVVVKRHFNISECLAFAMAAQYQMQLAPLDRVNGIVQFISSLPLERLEAEMEAGRTFPVPASLHRVAWLPGIMIEPPSDASGNAKELMRRLDLVPIYNEVMARINKLDKAKAKRRQRRKKLRGAVATK
jgi:hypothetical protein